MFAVSMDVAVQQVGSTGAAPEVCAQTVDEVLTATRALIAVSARSLGVLAEDVSTAQYRMLVVLASRGPQRMVDLARLLHVNPSTAGRMCDRLVRKGLIHRHRARTDRRIVEVALTGEGRRVVDEVTASRRVVISEMLAALSVEQQQAAAAALRELSRAAGEIPDRDWPTPATYGELTGTAAPEGYGARTDEAPVRAGGEDAW
jgi:DNA-binding MarR family transcriptional regulator